MTEINITLEQLRQMVGTCVLHQGNQWQVVEVLEDGPELVLMNLCHNRVVQQDQYGDGYRRVLEHTTIRVLTEDKLELHPDFLALDLAEKQQHG